MLPILGRRLETKRHMTRLLFQMTKSTYSLSEVKKNQRFEVKNEMLEHL